MVCQTSILEGSEATTCKSVGMVLHKVTGYGIDRVAVDKGCCVDGRFAYDGYLFNRDAYSFEGFREFMKRDGQHCKELDCEGISLKDCVHYGQGANGGNTICLVAPHCIREWYRKDNLEDTRESEIGVSRTVLLDRGLPGYRLLMDRRDGRRIPSSIYIILQRGYDDYNSPSRCEAERYGSEYALGELASELGFGTVADAISYVAPVVPSIIERMAAYLNLFSDRRVVYSLRPMVYTYWE